MVAASFLYWSQFQLDSLSAMAPVLLGVHGTISPSVGLCVLSPLSCVRLFAIPWAVTCQAPLSKGFSRQEYWSGLPCPPPGSHPNIGIKPASLASPALAGRFFTTEPPGKPYFLVSGFINFAGRTGSLSFSHCFGAVRIALRRIKCSWYLNHLKHWRLKHGLRLYLASFSMSNDCLFL